MAHTPGPWRVSSNGDCVLIGPEKSIDYHIIAPGVRSDEVISNARLIAAAPELLEAAHHLFACDFPDEVDFRCDGCSAARAAIAKAEGR